MHPFEYVHASSLQAAQSQLKADGSVRLKAGGIEILDLLKERLVTPKRLVNLNTVSGLNTISYDAKKGLTLGPLVTLHAISQDANVKKHYPSLAQAASAVATPQIRNVATLAGNLCQRPRCWYFRSEDFKCRKKGGGECFAQKGENEYHAIYNNLVCAMVHPSTMALPLLALQATLSIHNGKKTRTTPLDGFFVPPETNPLQETILKPTEIITAIHLPPPSANLRSLYHKQKQKESFDWPLAEFAISATIERNTCKQIRIVLGAAAPVPWRLTQVEQALTNKALSESNITNAVKLLRKGARTLAQNAYKLELFEALLQRALTQLNAQS